jgi:protein O-mannosyl-transferase
MTEPAQMTPPPPAGEVRPGSRLARLAAHPAFISLLLAAAVGLVFFPVLRCQFINLDDPLYVTSNSHVQGGLTLDGLVWAFRTSHAGNWHPLTWLSHMLDCRLYGLKPAGHHLTNLLFHALNSMLLFILLRRLTGAGWRSAFVAALFALHPCHVESVAWVSERKDVLSTFFFMLTLWAYARYAEKSVISNQSSVISDQWPVNSGQSSKARAAAGGEQTADRRSLITDHRSLFYLLSLFFFALGLMSKPMLVTLPFVLLLLDYWPLQRFRSAPRNPTASARRFQPSSFILHPLLVEKTPFFLLSAISCVVTFIVQKQGGAVQPLAHLALLPRIENALVAYERYLSKMIWPAGLATPYPGAEHWSFAGVVFALALLAGLTLGAAWLSRKYRFVATGWLWFLGTLVPVIGLVQVGEQLMADRYTYLSSIGLFIILVWGASVACDRWQLPKVLCAGVAGLMLLSCVVQTRHQLGYWRDSEVLFHHTLAVTRKNWAACYNLGWYLDDQGRLDEALGYYRQSVEIEPRNPDPLNNIGVALVAKKQYAEAIPYFEAALKAQPNFFEAHNNIGKALEELQRFDEAIAEYRLVLQRKPDHVAALNNLGNALARKGQLPEAIQSYEAALRAKPDQANAHYGLASALARLNRMDEAIDHYRLALQHNPDNAAAHNDLGLVLARQGNLDEAALQFREAVRCKPDDPALLCNLGRALAGRQKLDEALPLFARALSLAPTNADAHAGLGQALAATGKMDDAVAHFQEAVRLRPDSASAHFNLGRGLAAQGKSEDAIRQFNEALRLKPDFAPARQALQSLSGQKTP